MAKTLTGRLLLAAGIWLLITLFACSFLLVALFREHAERQYDGLLLDHLEELVAASEVNEDESLVLTWTPSDPRFNRPLSGWYWLIIADGNVIEKSPSIWTYQLEIQEPVSGSGPKIQTITGPTGAQLRTVVEDIALPGRSSHLYVVVSAPAKDLEEDIFAFSSKLALTMVLLGGGLMIAVYIQIRYGLKPLSDLKSSLAEIRDGLTRRLPETFPDEVQPVVTELNSLLSHSDELVDRARTQSGNLAHALKNPLTVIKNEVSRLPEEQRRIIEKQVSLMTGNITRYLSHARAAGTGQKLGARTPIRMVVENIVMVMRLLHEKRNLEINIDIAESVCFRGDEQDLEEMLGNIVDNANKWAVSRISICATPVDAGKISLTIEDDGPGIAENAREDVLQRGQRLDQSMPGSGLGMSIVQDIVTLYRGKMILSASDMGGLKVTFILPGFA